MIIKSRSAWGARPAKSVTAMPWPRVRYNVLHWPGRRAPIALTDDAVAAAIRAWQRYHQDSQGWSDLAYNHVVDQRGVAWEGRGFYRQDGSVKNMGGQVYSVLLADGTGAPPSPAAKRTILALFARANALAGRTLAKRYHGQLAATDCAGSGSNAWARAGFPPPPAPPAPTPDPIQQPTEEPEMDINDRIPMPAWGPGATISVGEALAASAELLFANVGGQHRRLDDLVADISVKLDDVTGRLEALAKAELGTPEPPAVEQ